MLGRGDDKWQASQRVRRGDSLPESGSFPLKVARLTVELAFHRVPPTLP